MVFKKGVSGNPSGKSKSGVKRKPVVGVSRLLADMRAVYGAPEGKHGVKSRKELAKWYKKDFVGFRRELGRLEMLEKKHGGFVSEGGGGEIGVTASEDHRTDGLVELIDRVIREARGGV